MELISMMLCIKMTLERNQCNDSSFAYRLFSKGKGKEWLLLQGEIDIPGRDREHAMINRRNKQGQGCKKKQILGCYKTHIWGL